MTVSLSAPYPGTKVTSILPNPIFGNVRQTQSRIEVKRSMTGRVWTYAKPNDRESVSLTFNLTRQKDLELGEFLRIYQTATWKLTDHNGRLWKVQLVGEPVRRTSKARAADTASSTGGEIIELTINLSAEALP